MDIHLQPIIGNNVALPDLVVFFLIGDFSLVFPKALFKLSLIIDITSALDLCKSVIDSLSIVSSSDCVELSSEPLQSNTCSQYSSI